ncbi:PD-(D/E)XK nuclease family protein [Chitinispirillales bacterium ANBcel5]|uniref:RecB family exonuclease n=1 Tax=Cellulosispirillum alkaliphilum TaxID=3039283 RepID=UPI002A50B2A5|nr:PD-(D/E)XK nuclease family protein [Chitinispirillales bacterium ANBcel5]
MNTDNQSKTTILKYAKYPFTPLLGWSISRYEVFDKCKRCYYYTYYSRHCTEIPHYKLTKLRELTSVPLEVGNVIHHVIEAFLHRLQLSDSDIDEERFFQFGLKKAKEYFSSKTFIETYYGRVKEIDFQRAVKKIERCLNNFLQSPCYSWIFMKAITNRDNWMIEPGGMGETRLNGMKAYCKMDFLFPVGDEVHILDWKTGAKDYAKHSTQLIGYAAAASSNFDISYERIIPRIVYLSPEYDEMSIQLSTEKIEEFIDTVREQTDRMYSYCKEVDRNIPLSIDNFPKSPSPSLCRYCNYQELCFPKGLGEEEEEEF